MLDDNKKEINHSCHVTYRSFGFNDLVLQNKYIFQAGTLECEKCKQLDGTEVSEDVWNDEQKMKKLGFWKQADGSYKPHPNCKCFWRKDSITDEQIKLLNSKKKIFDCLIQLNISKSNIRNYAQIVQNTLTVLQNTNPGTNPVSYSLSTLSSAIDLMCNFFQKVEAEYKYLKLFYGCLKEELEENPRIPEFVKVAMDFMAHLELDIKQINIPSKKEHYERLNMKIQQIKYLPKTPEEAIQKGFIKALPRENQYHGVHLGNQKFTHPISGQEVVFDKNNNIVTDPHYLGTYNYGKKAASLGHFFNDIYPYWRWANSPLDTTVWQHRVFGPIYFKYIVEFLRGWNYSNGSMPDPTI